jgi:hypothetical protein
MQRRRHKNGQRLKRRRASGGVLFTLHIFRGARKQRLVCRDVLIQLSPCARIPAMHLPPCTRQFLPPVNSLGGPRRWSVGAVTWTVRSSGSVWCKQRGKLVVVGLVTVWQQEMRENALTVLGVYAAAVHRLELLRVPGLHKGGWPAHHSSTSGRDPRCVKERADVARTEALCRISCGTTSPAMALTQTLTQCGTCTAATTARVHRRAACFNAYTNRVGARTTSVPSRRSDAGAPPRTPMGAAASPSRASSWQRSPDGRVRTHARVPPAHPSSLRSPCRPGALTVSARRAASAPQLGAIEASKRNQDGVHVACGSPAGRLHRLVPARRKCFCFWLTGAVGRGLARRAAM